MKKIEVSEDVWEALKSAAIPFEEPTPNDVLRRILKLTKGRSSNDVAIVTEHSDESTNLTPKSRGNFNRKLLVDQLSRMGITLSHYKNIVYTTSTGIPVAVPTATERTDARWFIGMALSLFREVPGLNVILLCEGRDQLRGFGIPHNILERIIPALSRDQNDQLKFNVYRKGEERFWLSLKQNADLEITEFKGNFDFLRSQTIERNGDGRMMIISQPRQKRTEVCVYKTDPTWIEFLSRRNICNGVNFWRRDLRDFHLQSGMPFYFLKRHTDEIWGRGIFRKSQTMTTKEAWDVFQEKNGRGTYQAFLEAARNTLGVPRPEYARIGCLIVDEIEWLDFPIAFEFDRGTWVHKSFQATSLQKLIDNFDKMTS